MAKHSSPIPIQTSSGNRRSNAKAMPVTSQYPKALSKSTFPRVLGAETAWDEERG